MYGVQNKLRQKVMKNNRSKKKLQVKVTAKSLGTMFPETNLDKLIMWLQITRDELVQSGFSNLELSYIAEWDSPYDISITGIRDETDKEFNNRMKAIEKEKRQEAVKMQEHMKFIETEAKKLGILK
jgi:hypothetical protein